MIGDTILAVASAPGAGARAVLRLSGPAAREAAADVQLRELHDALLQPARSLLQGKTQLIIAPDGFLWNLPFAALQSGEGHYLIEDFAISYSPFATALQAMTMGSNQRILSIRK